MISIRFLLLNVGIVVLGIINCHAEGAQQTSVKFPKDQRMDATFPPEIDIPYSPELPIGHLRPLGKSMYIYTTAECIYILFTEREREMRRVNISI